MAFITVAAAVGGGSAILGGALIGAGIGGTYSAITGDGDILNSMLTGGLIGAGGTALLPAAPATAVTPLAPAGAAATAAPTASASLLNAAAVTEGATTAGMVPAANTGLAANTVLPASMTFTPPVTSTAAGLTGKQMLGYGLAGTTELALLGGEKACSGAIRDPGMIRPVEYSSTLNQSTRIYSAAFAKAD